MFNHWHLLTAIQAILYIDEIQPGAHKVAVKMQTAEFAANQFAPSKTPCKIYISYINYWNFIWGLLAPEILAGMVIHDTIKSATTKLMTKMLRLVRSCWLQAMMIRICNWCTVTIKIVVTEKCLCTLFSFNILNKNTVEFPIDPIRQHIENTPT